MSISEENIEKLRQKFEEDIKNIDEDDVEYASKKGTKKIDEMAGNIPASLKELWNDIKQMVSLVTDYYKGDYRDIPWKVIAAITGAIVYFISPIDFIPDTIPVFGYIDDAMVVRLALDYAREDLEKYNQWRNI